jgi:hypothetical protein
MAHTEALRNLIHHVRHGHACRFIARDDRERAEQAITAIETVLATVESEATFGEDDTVSLPLWAFDRLRGLREPAPVKADPPAPTVAPAEQQTAPAQAEAPTPKAAPRKRKADAAPLGEGTAPPAKAKRSTTRKAKAAPAPKDSAPPSTTTPPIATATPEAVPCTAENDKDSATSISKPADTAPAVSVACQDVPGSKPGGRSIEELAAILRGHSAIDVIAALGKAGMLAAVLKAALRPGKVA